MSSYIGNSPTLVKRQLFRFIATANQSVFSEQDVNLQTLNYTPGQEDVYLNGIYIPPANYTASNGSTITFQTGVGVGDEVSIIASGAFNPADTNAASANGADIQNKVLFRQNVQISLANSYTGYMVNPVYEISQEKDTIATTVSTNNVATYITDQWAANKNGTVVLSGQAISGNLSSISSMRGYTTGSTITATTAQASYSSGEFAQPFLQPIEGSFVKTLAWGTADAKAVDIAFIATGSIAGTYALAVRNAAGDRSYVTTFTLAANVPTLIFKTIPGPTVGSWITNNNNSIQITLGGVSGSSFQAPTLNVWANSNYISHSSATNWTATTNATFTLNFCNMYQNGILPYSEGATTGLIDILNGLRMSYEDEIRRCQRYYCEIYAHARGGISGVGSSGTQALGSITFPTQMRVIPTSVVKDPGVNSNVINAIANISNTSGGFLAIDSAAAGDFYVTNRRIAFISRM